MRPEQIEAAVDLLYSADPAAVVAAFEKLHAVDPDAAVRAESALQLLAATDHDSQEFWAAINLGHGGSQ